MSAGNWRDQVPSRTEAEQRAADESEARRERLLDVLLGLTILLVLVLLGWAVHLIGGGGS